MFTSNPLQNYENVSPIFKDLNWAQVTYWFGIWNDRLKTWIFFCNCQAYSTHHLPDHATINIQISDANDNPPTFSAKYYSFSIKENAGIGAIVGEVKASDVDQVSSSSFVMFCVSEKNIFVKDLLPQISRKKSNLPTLYLPNRFKNVLTQF